MCTYTGFTCVTKVPIIITQGYNDIHRAITFPLIFIICRALYIVGLLLGHAIDFLYLSYIPLLMNILLEIVIVIESHHIPIINKIC